MTERERLIDWTGERCVPWADDIQVIYEHYHRYALAARFAAGKRVLDLACGEGYGSALLAASAAEVVGVDVDPDTVAHAARTYPQATFSVGSITDEDLLADAGRFDVITCFEAIEHVAEHEKLLAMVRARLTPGGVFLVSTPDVEIYTHEHGNENHFHVRELTEAEFRELLGGAFAEVTMLRQNLTVGSAMLGEHAGTTVGHELRGDVGTWTVGEPAPHTYLLAVASDVPQQVPSAAVLHDGGQRLLQHAVYRVRDALEAQIASVTGERDAARGAFDATKAEVADVTAALDAERAHARGVRAERDAAREELARHQHRAQLADARLAWLTDGVTRAEAEIGRLRGELHELRKEHSAAIGRVLSRYRGAVERFAPRGTPRRDLYERALGRPAGVAADAPDLGPVAVGTSDSPLVSVIVPVHGKWAYTRACLASIAASNPRVPFEVVVVDDASPDDSAERLRGCAGVRLVSAPHNLGFVGACNLGAREARGELLMFLNNDTEVRHGWLDALVDTAFAEPDIGLVGAKQVYPNGAIAECGGIVFADGNGWNYGRHFAEDEPRFAVRRDVDYCSGAAILVRADVFDGVGGFDARYSPAYYEDTDLAFAVREAGYRTLVQPRAVVVHHEGVSNGTDTGAGIKRHQELNRAVFAEKWAHRLREHLPYADPMDLGALWTASTHTAAGHGGGIVLVVDHQVPTPDKDSGSVRMRRLLDVLLSLDQRVVFFASNGWLPPSYVDPLRQAGVTVLGTEEGQQEFLREAGAQLRLVLLSRPNVAWKYAEQVRDVAPRALLVYDTVDLHHVRLARQAEVAAGLGDDERAAALRKRAAASRELELGLVRSADVALTVSGYERDLLLGEVPDADVRVLSNVHSEQPGAATPAGRSRVLFVGSWDHHPNSDAARWLVAEIMPRVRAVLPDVELDIVGSNPPAEILALTGDGVTAHGWVPELAPLYAAARVSVAPLRFGAGVKGKVGESLALGVPVVGTPVAFEGTALTGDREVLVAEDPAGLAAAIVALCTDDARWQRLSDAGRVTIAEQFGPAIARATLDALLAETAAAR